MEQNYTAYLQNNSSYKSSKEYQDAFRNKSLKTDLEIAESQINALLTALGGTSSSGNGFRFLKSIKTPYGRVRQSISKDALNIYDYTKNRGVLYRGGELGKGNTLEAQFWATENPLTPGYANKYGVALDKFDYVIQGKIKPNSKFITRKAPGVNHNKGGGIEVVTKKIALS